MRLGALRRLRRRQTPVPAVPTSLAGAIGDDPNTWTLKAQLEIRARLVLAAEGEWATTALASFDRDANAFLRHYWQAELDRATTDRAVWHALADLMNIAGTGWRQSARRRSFEKALSRLGLTEAEWIAGAGLGFEIHTAPNAAESAATDAQLKERNS